MKLNTYSLIFLLNSYINGLLIPVLSLLLIDKGLTLSGLSIIMGIYAFIIIVFELPTGVMSDLIGRKWTFCFSQLASILSSLIILIGKGFPTIIIGIVFYGLSRAISSGSFDALFIDSYIDHFGKEKLNIVTTRLNVLDSLGLAAGALTGGFLPKIKGLYFHILGLYDLNLIIKIFLSFIIFILAVILVKETTYSHSKKRVSIKKHIGISTSFVKGNKIVIFKFVSVLTTGYFLNAFETYWQLQLVSLINNKDLLCLLGIMAFLYFAMAVIGSIISNKIISKFNPKKMYLLLRTCLSFFIFLTALQTNLYFFIICYLILYLIFGMANIPEGVMLNRETPANIRASILSVNSLVMQIGTFLGSLINSIIIKQVTIHILWIVTSIVILIPILYFRKESQTKAGNLL